MESAQSTVSTKVKVGLFTLLALLLVGIATVLVNDHPFWWRACQPVVINIDDATGLKSKSAVRSLGIDIGFLEEVSLRDKQVQLRICVTAPVEILPETKAYIRSEGFLGDRFVDLKPVRRLGEGERPVVPATIPAAAPPSPQSSRQLRGYPVERAALKVLDLLAALIPSAQAADQKNSDARPIPVGSQGQDMQAVTERVDTLVKEIHTLTKKVNDGIDPQQLRDTLKKLNQTLANASKTLSPEGGLNTTAQRTLDKLEDAISQLRDLATRVNRGEGSVGMLLNDPTYAEELRLAIKNVNSLLNRVAQVRFVVDIGGEQHPAYDSGRGWFKLSVWPRPDRYYLIGISVDPRGKVNLSTTTTTSGSTSTTVETRRVEENGLLLTGMVGQTFIDGRLDFAVGVLHADATLTTALNLGPLSKVEMFRLENNLYTRGNDQGGVQDRLSVILNPFPSRLPFRSIYLKGGLESFQRLNGKRQWFYGAGLTFDDEDIKLLFALK